MSNANLQRSRQLSSLKELVSQMISVSELSRGRASKIIDEVAKKKKNFLVIKNNKPQAIIVPIDVYDELIQVQEDYKLLKLALKRTENLKQENCSTFEEVVKEAGFSMEEIDKLAESVEIE
ncbi:prevent-host-death family protein [Caldicellulosiruptor saccharolyticus DSM 8903]|uniref:Antitoxin n=1 Tax=Caldicellulosiruptor saccharolyticus (strain ATCC 43494 / DSM 8903 / Tp8T 6331) TaxID=351627 RepID=A4XMT1_CALS8|nr:type II toxin-antitoxin system Phd/YefM family antitoxin [Caldicellulosiruptor saccharolyticus]ABP68216.1 prevent-host-death family protein [Caldicellulosiruptor saccharolyticus DSM 8903]